MKIESLAVASLVALTTLHVCGQGTLYYDQQSSTGPVLEGGNYSMNFSQPLGQSFTPSLNAVGFINLNLQNLAPPTIGTSETVLIPATFEGASTLIFDTPASVTPGTQYFFQVVLVSGSQSAAVTSSRLYNYGGGDAIYQGGVVTGNDLWFQEGIIVPEPSTWALLLLGAGMIVWHRRR